MKCFAPIGTMDQSLSRYSSACAFLVAACVIASSGAQAGQATAQSASTAAPRPAPTASPARGFTWSTRAFATYLDTAADGAGLTPPEGPAFITGSPLSPMTPYDTWSSAPQTPGEAVLGEIDLFGHYTGSKYDAAASIGIGFSAGSMQNAVYWGENLLPSLNPHLNLSPRPLPYAPNFATHAGLDDFSEGAAELTSASIGAHDGSWLLRSGFFDLNQTERFVFIQPPLTNVTPSIGITTAETLGDGPASLDAWPSPPPGLPLRGLDLTAHHGIGTLELTDAALPAVTGTSVRTIIGSLVLDHGEGTRYSMQLLHAFSGGDPISTTTMYGSGAQTNPGPQGPLPTSMLGGQMETIAGLHAAFHLTPAIDVAGEFGRTWYDANDVLKPGTSAPGDF